MPAIFISYRREDSVAYSGRLYDRLTAEFGEGQVFMDIDSIDPGADFIEVIQQTVAACDTVVVVIGRQWLTACDAQGRRRIENPDDFVRLEVETALSRKVRVVPVLVGGAQMPRSDELPATLGGLSRRHALDLPDTGFHQTLGRLIDALRRYETQAGVRREQERLSREAGPEEQAERAGQMRVNPRDGLTYIWIPPGTFTMGCSPGDIECRIDEKPAHQVTISTGFWIGQTPVTQQAYERVMGKKPSHFKGSHLPVECVNWNDAQSYCLTAGMRLPTEAQWEYAARAGNNTTSRYGNIDQVAWHAANSGKKTHDVAQKQPNAWGLYDMLGNVWEWTADWYTHKYAGSSETDPRGPVSGAGRVYRGGGCWLDDPRAVRVSRRSWCTPEDRVYYIGFRCVGNLVSP